MADKTTELERIYTIPLRKTKDLVRSRRADLAIRDVKRFLSRHMKSETIWLDNTVNEMLWQNGKFSIPSRIRVRATRFNDGVVEVTLPESTATGSIRDTLQERREKAAEAPVLKAPEPEEGEEGHQHEGSDRPTTDVKGIGPASAEKLEKAEIKTLGDLAHADAKAVADALGTDEEKAKAFIDDAHAILEGKTDVADVKAQPALEKAEAEKADAEKADAGKADAKKE
ncbi:MAG: large subunit ribosomal protein L31e [Thermoplasmata archaeon]|jgi:large subunit ribosomal protein L31e|nr:large subunit ribosomal protein L31e [Thermoplasmata archaeon]